MAVFHLSFIMKKTINRMLCSRAQCVVHVVAVLRIVALIIDDIRGLRKTAGMLFTHVSKSNQHCFWSIWWSAGIFLSCCLLMNQLYRNKLISYVKNFNSISCMMIRIRTAVLLEGQHKSVCALVCLLWGTAASNIHGAFQIYFCI